MRWFTADLHLGHANILRYCDRPFADVRAMDAGLVDNWNTVVAPTDEVWVLGDFALGRIADSLPLAARLHGRKVLLPGNHDRCWRGHPRSSAAWEQRYLDAGFDEIRHGTVPTRLGSHRVLASHFPYRGDSHDVDRHVEHRPVDRGDWLLHGHVHGKWQVHERQVDVGVDARAYRPVSEDELDAVFDDAAG